MVAEDEQIIHIAQVSGRMKGSLDVVVKPIEVDVGGEELTGVGADRQTPQGERVSMCHGEDRFARSLEHSVNEFEERFVSDRSCQQSPENVEIDAREVSFDVEM